MLGRCNLKFYRDEMFKSNCFEVPEHFWHAVNWQWEAESLNLAMMEMVLELNLETLISNGGYLFIGMLKEPRLFQNLPSSIGQFTKVTHSRKIFWSQQIRRFGQKKLHSFQAVPEIDIKNGGTFLVWPVRLSCKPTEWKLSKKNKKVPLSWKPFGQRNSLYLPKRKGGSPSSISLWTATKHHINH